MKIFHYGLDYAKLEVNGEEFEISLALAKAIEAEQESRDTITISWHISDIQGLDDTLTDEQARTVLSNFERHHEGSMESMWEDLKYHIDDFKIEQEIKGDEDGL